MEAGCNCSSPEAAVIARKLSREDIRLQNWASLVVPRPMFDTASWGRSLSIRARLVQVAHRVGANTGLSGLGLLIISGHFRPGPVRMCH